MNAKLRAATLSLSVVMLSACTTMDERSTAIPAAGPMTEEERYIAYVERVARIRGIEVVWVNKPEATRSLVASSDE
ncbi:hypothetical protein [Lysobacter sp. A3-1-A15]|uniref:hypothetical protein n=1 Tax=Novilysobacter viscosus TaxID=3098602 RepID=UPI002ED985B8